MNLEDLSNEEVLSGVRALAGEGPPGPGASSGLSGRGRTATARSRIGLLVLLLRDHLTEDGHEELLREVAHKTKSEVEHLIAQRFPRPDAPLVVEPLPPLPLTPRSPHAAVSAGPTATSELRAPRIEPLSPERYRVQFTASAKLKRKIERAANLMRHTNAAGDLSVLMERAVDLLIAQLEKQRLGKEARPRQTPPKRTRRGYIPRALRREVFERDGEQCTFATRMQGAASHARCSSSTTLRLARSVEPMTPAI